MDSHVIKENAYPEMIHWKNQLRVRKIVFISHLMKEMLQFILGKRIKPNASSPILLSSVHRKAVILYNHETGSIIQANLVSKSQKPSLEGE